MKKIVLFGSMLFVSLLAACDREKEPLSSIESQAASIGKLPPEGNYIPLVYGSKWAYDDGAMTDTTFLRGDTVLRGKAYKKFENLNGVYYLRYTDKVYYRLEASPVIVTDSTGLYERIELRTDYGIGKMYEQRFSKINNGYFRIETTLTNILKDRYVKGKKYNTVLEVINRLYEKNPGDSKETVIGTAYQYFAKDKGLIELIETGGGKRLTYYNY